MAGAFLISLNLRVVLDDWLVAPASAGGALNANARSVTQYRHRSATSERFVPLKFPGM